MTENEAKKKNYGPNACIYQKKAVILHAKLKGGFMQKDKITYIVALIAEFAKRFGITDAEAAQYMNRYHATALCDKHYGIMHTLSFADNVDSIAAYCRRQGGTL